MSDNSPIHNPIINNPFEPRKEPETMKYVIRNERGEMYQKEVWYAGMNPAEMRSIDIIKALWDADKTLLEMYLNEQRHNDKHPEKKAFEGVMMVVDDSYLDMRSILKEFAGKVRMSGMATHGEWDFSPLHVVSYRFLMEDSYIRKIDGEKVKINRISMYEMLVTEKKSDKKPGFVIEFRSHVKNSLGQVYTKNWPVVFHINKTPNGVRFLWRNNKTKETHWGVGYYSIARKNGVPQFPLVTEKMANAFQSVRNKMVKHHDIHEILKYIPLQSIEGESHHPMSVLQDQNDTWSSYPYPIDQFSVYWIGGSTSVKDILNKAFDTKRDEQGRLVGGITKKAFGGLNNIDNFIDLRAAINVVRALRGFDPHIFEKMNTEYVEVWTHEEDGIRFVEPQNISRFAFSTTRDFANIRYHFQHFGNDEDLALKFFMEGSPRVTWTITDTVRAFRGIRSQRLRRAIKAEIKRQKMDYTQIHDYVMQEWNKIKHENQVFSSTTLWKKHRKLQHTMISPDIQLVLPSTTHEMIEWGNTQSNCIGSYADRVLNNDTIIVGFKDSNGEWIGHAQFTEKGELNQLLGKHNQKIEDSYKKVIVDFLVNEFEVSADQYWGR